MAIALRPETSDVASVTSTGGGHRANWPDIIERLAEWNHEQWRKGSWEKPPPLDVPYARLAPQDQDNNRAAAARIASILRLAGLEIVPRDRQRGRQRAPDRDIGARLEGNMERLAKAEHDGWMTQRAKQGWRYGTPRDDALKLHPSMVAYEELPEPEKEKDRVAVRHYRALVEAAGFDLVLGGARQA